MTASLRQPSTIAAAYPHRYAVVDVETSGLVAQRSRVLSIAVVHVASDGTVERRWSTLLNPGCDPGPVHIHGLTRERLAGSPTFDRIVDSLLPLLDDRIFVAHNAVFDWQMLATEAMRIGIRLPVEWRLCTRVLARRLDLDLPNLKLATLADHWGVVQRRAHDAVDDADVLAALLPQALEHAAGQYLDLPLTPCGTPRDDATIRPAHDRTTGRKPRCRYVNPGPLAADGPLIQGMQVAFTGDSITSRDTLAEEATTAGLHVTSAVSRRTSAVVTNNIRSGTAKARAALAHGTTVLDEQIFLRLLSDVRPGRLREQTAPDIGSVLTSNPNPNPTATATHTSHPFAGRRILVLGEPYATATQLRERITAFRGIPAVNVTASLALTVCLDGGEQDRRMPRIRHLGIPVVPAETFLRDIAASRSLPDSLSLPPATGGTEPDALLSAGATPRSPRSSSSRAATGRVLPCGGVQDLPTAVAGTQWTIAATWSWDACDVDVVAFLVGDDDLVGADEDFVFYNQPQAAGGAAVLNVDGPAEQAITVDLAAVPNDTRKIIIAAALDGSRTFGEIGPVEISAQTPDAATWLRATLDAATTERTLILVEIYRRADAWRFRAVGQGYDHGLAELARVYGVEIED
ncbi:DEDDh family exonuclease [Frankia sp. Cas3]|uniref:DEDDh family exonuclease n=1 Tax=Frankia sp. Cas3 TaxID=3073926 RepID=UPI002AD26AF7|nr:DEDDh family exonuclease [Frankia sp. Cas3]